MAEIFLVRHGETDWNQSGQIMGERPVPLNQHGHAQATALAEVLQTGRIRALYSSPVTRAQQTAAILAAATHLAVVPDRGLTEIGMGDWEGRYWKELTEDLVRHNFYSRPHEARPPGGETLREVQDRAVAAVQRAVQQLGGEEARAVFVSHADVVRAIIAHYMGFDLQTVRRIRIDHASLSVLRLGDGTVDLLCLNYRPLPFGLT